MNKNESYREMNRGPIYVPKFVTIYNLTLFLFYSSVFIYLFLSLYGSYLVLIRYKILLVTNINFTLNKKYFLKKLFKKKLKYI